MHKDAQDFTSRANREWLVNPSPRVLVVDAADKEERMCVSDNATSQESKRKVSGRMRTCHRTASRTHPVSRPSNYCMIGLCSGSRGLP